MNTPSIGPDRSVAAPLDPRGGHTSPRVVVLARPHLLSDYLEDRLAERGWLAGAIHERRLRTMADRTAFVRALVRRYGVVVAADTVLYQVYHRLVRMAEVERAAERCLRRSKRELPRAIPRYEVSDLNTGLAREMVKALEADVLVVHGTRILKPETFQLARQCAINVHCGILPHYRGHDSLFWAWYRGDVENLGVTVHLIDEGVDTGPTVRQGRVAHQVGDTDISLWFTAFALGVDLVLDFIEALERGERIVPIRASSAESVYYRRRGLSDFVRFRLATGGWMGGRPARVIERR